VLGVEGSAGTGTEGLRSGARTGVTTLRISGFSKAMTASSLTRASSNVHFPTTTARVPRRGGESCVNEQRSAARIDDATRRAPLAAGAGRRGSTVAHDHPCTGDPTDGRWQMSGTSYAVLAVVIVGGLVFLAAVLGMFVTVGQNTVAVITMFGKYRRIMLPGLNFKLPFVEKIHSRVAVQNQAVELQFQATTIDQANVNFSTMVLYSVADASEETIKRVAFKFLDSRNFMRSYVATKRQAEILGLRTEIVQHVKEELDNVLAEWGYHLLDLQVNDISFGAAITQSMERVVASNNERVAAENEGAALLIRETKKAEAEGAAIKIAAAAEMEAARLRGQGVAAFRREVAQGMAEAAKAMEDADLDPSFVLFAMWTEAIRHFANEGEGNLITLDGSLDGMTNTIRQMMAAGHVIGGERTGGNGSGPQGPASWAPPAGPPPPPAPIT
jgi:regulator of protease activity HflC (stomatin/prohibitin superfamily)